MLKGQNGVRDIRSDSSKGANAVHAFNAIPSLLMTLSQSLYCYATYGPLTFQHSNALDQATQTFISARWWSHQNSLIDGK